MLRWWVLVLVTMTSCVQHGLVDCDEWLCPAGTACDVVHRSCVAPEQLTACDGAADLAACETSAIVTGHCFDGVCIEQACGNQFVEPGELCDDGNVSSADGCSADCSSTERCGDGVADLGEECDDGNDRSHDGCSAVCRYEDRIWRRRNIVPVARSSAAVTYDSARRSLVVFGGGNGSTVLGDTTVFSGHAWTDATMPTSPAPRLAVAMAYDRARHETILFGGFAVVAGGLRIFDDTWIWDGVSWRRGRPITGPPARFSHGMGWDGDHVIMVGGNASFNSSLADTWRWNGEEWSLVPTTAHPPAGPILLVFDPVRRRAVGLRRQGPDTEAWVFENGDWRLLPNQATNFYPTAAAYDAARDRIVVIGSVGPAPSSVPGTWELVDATWEDHTSAATVNAGAAYYDLRRGHVVALNSTTTGALLTEWDGTTWTNIAPTTAPLPRRNAGLASDPIRGRAVLFGGSQGPLLGDTWEWDGERWQQMPAGTTPEARELHAMAYDGSTVIMFGGTNASGPRSDTWRWNGSWSEVVGPGPSARSASAIAYDAERRRVVLFGGRDTVNLADTWEWDGAAWSLLASSGPPARAFASATYDPVRRRVVLFGGEGASGLASDTWEWDGATWTERTSTTTPAPRRDHQMVFDRARGRSSLFAGLQFDLSQWEWDGQAWSHESALTQPNGRLSTAAAYDDARGELLLFGGYENITGHLADTWTGSFRGSPEEVCETGLDLDGNGAGGCADPACRFVCEPACLVAPACGDGPRCGNGVCDGFETDLLCPQDPCTAAPPICGDGVCSPAESCAGEC